MKNQDRTHAQVRCEIFREWFVRSGMSQGAMAKTARVGPSTVSMIMSGDRLARETTLRKLVSALGDKHGYSYEQLEQEASQRIADAMLFGGGEFPALAVDASPYSLFVQYGAHKHALPYLRRVERNDGSFEYVNPPCYSEVLQSSELLEAVVSGRKISSDDRAPLLFCVANLRVAAEYERTHHYGLRYLSGWKIVLRPGFCLVEAVEPKNLAEQCTFAARLYQLGSGTSDARRQALTQVLESLNGRMIFVERKTEADKNVRTLVALAGLEVLEEEHWRERMDWPEGIGTNEVLLVHAPMWQALYGLRRGYFKSRAIVAGNSALIAAVREQRVARPLSRVLLTDEDVLSWRDADDPLRQQWCPAEYGIIAASDDYIGQEELAKAAEFFNGLFISLEKWRWQRQFEIVKSIVAYYEQNFGRGEIMGESHCEKLFRNDVVVERLESEKSVQFVPMKEE